MQTAHQQVESLLAQMNDRAKHDPIIERLSDQISVLCRGYMSLDTSPAVPGVHFPPSESKIFQLLRERLNKPVAKSALLDALSFDRAGDGPEVKIVDVHIHRIREKLEQSANSLWIETIWGIGYCLHDEPLPERIRAISKKAHGGARYVTASRTLGAGNVVAFNRS